MVNTGQLIKNRRKELGINAVEMANKLGVHHSTIYRYEKGDIEKMPSALIGQIADILDADPAYFLGLQKEPRLNIRETTPQNNPTTAILSQLTAQRQESVLNYATKQLEEQQQESHIDEEQELYTVNTVSELAAGLGFGYDDDDIRTVTVANEPPRHDIASLVNGDSMLPDYEDGDVVYLVDVGFSRYSGQVCAVVVDDETFIKRVYTEPNGLRLVSLNPAYSDKFIDFPPLGDTHIKIFKVIDSDKVVEK